MSVVNHFNVFIMQNDVIDDVRWMLTWHNLVGC
jgi:hypothetical protein